MAIDGTSTDACRPLLLSSSPLASRLQTCLVATRSLLSPQASICPEDVSLRSAAGQHECTRPWDTHHVEPPSSSTSRLHIVRLPPPTQEELAKVDREHGHVRRRSSGGSTKPMRFACPLRNPLCQTHRRLEVLVAFIPPHCRLLLLRNSFTTRDVFNLSAGYT